jgi:hypothetical protein
MLGIIAVFRIQAINQRDGAARETLPEPLAAVRRDVALNLP